MIIITLPPSLSTITVLPGQKANVRKLTVLNTQLVFNIVKVTDVRCQSVMGFLFCFVFWKWETQKKQIKWLKFVPLMVGLVLADQKILYYGIVLCQNHCFATWSYSLLTCMCVSGRFDLNITGPLLTENTEHYERYTRGSALLSSQVKITNWTLSFVNCLLTGEMTSNEALDPRGCKI